MKRNDMMYIHTTPMSRYECYILNARIQKRLQEFAGHPNDKKMRKKITEAIYDEQLTFFLERHRGTMH